MDAGVEAPGDQVAAAVVLRRDVEHHVGVVAGEALELRAHRHGDGDGGRDQADEAGRLLAEAADLRERGLDLAQGGP